MIRELQRVAAVRVTYHVNQNNMQVKLGVNFANWTGTESTDPSF